MGAPLAHLNETEIAASHQPTPPSYYWSDIMDPQGERRYPGLMAVHVLSMGLAFFGALPAGIALRSVKSAWHPVTVILFYTFATIGVGASMLYRKLTPDMYEGERHSSQGYGWLFFAAALSAVDTLAILLRAWHYVVALRRGEESFGIKSAWKTVILGRDEPGVHLTSEYTNLVAEDELEAAELKTRDIESEDSESETLHERRNQPMQPIRTIFDARDSDHEETAQWANSVPRHARQPSYPQSAASERTLFGPRSPRDSDDTLHVPGPWYASENRAWLMQKIGRAAFGTSERVLVFAGFMQVLTGIVTYTGGCRQNWINGCLAHLIKGGIFWCYGLVTFARYLGSFSELGWAWNRVPSGNYPSAEFVESLVVFVYGITNTWMERFGAHPGDPYTTKQVQHISIAVMFWFAGLIGMGIESKRIRRWLAAGSTAAMGINRGQEAVAEPPSYAASFNPFPALCIGITGAAMAAHAQTYLFQVQIHMLWGNLLTGFAVLRCLTYFFVWLSPPRSILPSRPPTEALASFLLACGGLMFMFSTEEVTIAAMRQGHDDMMMFLNVGVAITCLAFCWVLSVVALKGWLKSRTHAAVKFHASA
ncbi:uncharacterized protein C8Q71DRAFT_793568 [Rhodofomes roseus]|uniref:Uncharacterized protein n=1 Tax=Rhodofomes roseus TaxID=34475 RepID=A0ABQ8KXA4_9APHY|nr:uncharacterized protein C8Q71DRAFT_793568 [Rhodofomes roseus]KAH9843933.1 hypothetical protein C8Q71DRAFT_793568 [Rhodofomes roseus]